MGLNLEFLTYKHIMLDNCLAVLDVAAMLDDVHSRLFGIIPKGIKWQPC